MNRGQVDQVGSPEEIYERPASRFVADFIGETNFLDGTVRAIEPERAIVELDGGRSVAATPASSGTTSPGERVTVVIRPENLKLTHSRRPDGEPDGPGSLHGRVEEIVYRGSDTDILVRVGDQSVVRVRSPRGSAGSTGGSFEFGAEVVVDWDVGAARLLRS
jgi:spermidine/putrescine transport system ATP-binding protein